MGKVGRHKLPPRWGRYWVSCCIVGVAIALSGCARGKGSLQDRAQEYLHLKQRKQWEEVYDGYLDPSLRGKLSKEAFLRKRALSFDILRNEVKEVKETGDEADVVVNGEANFPVREFGGKTRIVKREFNTTDRWVKRDGVWYIVLTE